MKAFGIAAVAALVALVVGFGARLGSTTPTAHADTTDLVVIGCEQLAPYVDGDGTNATTGPDVDNACQPGLFTPVMLKNVADTIGNADGKLTPEDFRGGAVNEVWDDNQLSSSCTNILFDCALITIVFTDNETTVKFDADNGLLFAINDGAGSNDWTCDTDAEDADCSNVTSNNGDGLVMDWLILPATGATGQGDTAAFHITQGATTQDGTATVVGPPHDINLTLVESTISTSGSAANRDECVGSGTTGTTPGIDVTDAAAAANATLAIAAVTDNDGTALARASVSFKVTPPGDDGTVARIGKGNSSLGVTGVTAITIDPETAGAPVAAYATICGGSGTGTTTIVAQTPASSLIPPLTFVDDSSADLTVVGAPSAITATVSPAQIACDGTETAKVTAKVTDSNGNNVADGTEVNFSVVALGTANPINTTTKDGVASTTITPLSNASAGVTVVITAGNSDIATQVQSSARVDCALPIAVSPTAAATPPGGITGPDTGNGGYLGQDSSSSFSLWTLFALAAASLTLVAGGVVVRRSK